MNVGEERFYLFTRIFSPSLHTNNADTVMAETKLKLEGQPVCNVMHTMPQVDEALEPC
ncbi:predicted protein [Plenodomus lingam JN3]|uniref:Predicted protein n=1 Tax=Leptosphaeria maculans (strain JN3 / isolate v23.1.3 / race Av1-4-5-6-7-8) TaxID=985895 RepID=E5A265_LEPMJ|nr:predicted protein [Plenodomus lingam JN3]CBX97942.1 predicted protein [Plenodomus lingam JN3]